MSIEGLSRLSDCKMPNIKSSVLLFFLFTFFALAMLVTGQLHTKADWCRFVSIVSRPLKSAGASTECYIPLKPADRNSITLRDTIDPEWQWSLDVAETSNGQAFVIDSNTVMFLSQKVCLDAGNATGHLVRPLYRTVGNMSKPVGLIGDFRVSHTSDGDMYRGCTKSSTTWRNFTFKCSIRDKGIPFQANTVQYVQVHNGLHEGLRIKLMPFDFNYTAKELEVAFQTALKQASARHKHPEIRQSSIVKSGEPILLNILPFETGHTLIATNSTSGSYKDIFHDLTIVAWNRLLKSVASLAGRPAPPVLLPESLKEHDIMALTVLAIISLITFKQALSAVASARCTHVRRWDPPRGISRIRHWALIKTASEHSHLARYQPPFRSQNLSGPSVALLTAIVTILGALLHFRRSTWRYNKFIVVRQGGLVTYGPSNATNWSYDLNNGFAGALFVVGHWYMAQIIEVGHPGVFEIIAAWYCLLIISLFYILYKFATVREHKLDKDISRVFLHFFRALPQALIGGLLRLCPFETGTGFFSSYRSVYFSIAKKLASDHGLNLEPSAPFSKMWDGKLIPSARVRAQEIIVEGNDEVQLTEDDVEKAAAFLAADRFGRLSYPQAIALLSCDTLLQAADNFRNFGHPLRARYIRGFAQLYYVTGVLLPEQSERHGILRDQFHLVEAGVQIRSSVAMLLGVPPAHQGALVEGHGFAVVSHET